MRAGCLGLGTAIVLAGCMLQRPSAPPPNATADVLLARANDLARDNARRSAHQLYRQILRQYPKTPEAGEALWGLASLHVDPESPLHDYVAARGAFARLVADYPYSPHVAEARAWQAALDDLLRSQAETRRLRADLDNLKELDMEQERRP